MGHFSGGCDEVFAFAGAGKAGADAEGGFAGAGAAAIAGSEGDGSITWLRGGGILLATGAGCWRASFFLIKISQPNCFSCSSAISLESTSLLTKKHTNFSKNIVSYMYQTVILLASKRMPKMLLLT